MSVLVRIVDGRMVGRRCQKCGVPLHTKNTPDIGVDLCADCAAKAIAEAVANG